MYNCRRRILTHLILSCKGHFPVFIFFPLRFLKKHSISSFTVPFHQHSPCKQNVSTTESSAVRF